MLLRIGKGKTSITFKMPITYTSILTRKVTKYKIKKDDSNKFGYYIMIMHLLMKQNLFKRSYTILA